MADNKKRRPLVLIVDDLPAMRRVVSLEINAIGYDSEQAANGFEALAKISTKTYDAIILDCLMPGIDGLQCSARIRELESLSGMPRVPIIGFSSDDIREACLAADMDDHLPKSYNLKQLRTTLNKWLVRT